MPQSYDSSKYIVKYTAEGIEPYMTQNDDTTADPEILISHEEIRMLYSGMPVSAIATVSISLIAYVALSEHVVSQTNLQIWLFILLLVTALRTWDTYVFNAATAEQQQSKKWGTRFIIGAASGGISWGLLGWLGYSTYNEYLALISIIIVGVCGGATASLSYRWQSITVFMAPALGLLELRMLFGESEIQRDISYLLGCFIIFAVLTARRIYLNTSSNVRLRIEASLREQMVSRTKEIAERANQAKSDFLSSMSHELRTPLNAIVGFTQLMEYDKGLTRKQHQQISEITHAGTHLLNLVNQILDLARIEEGKHDLKVTELSANDVIHECIKLTSAMSKKQLITIETKKNCIVTVKADATAFKQICLNLLTNAIKYNKPGGKVSISCEQGEAGFARLCFTDTGYGISPNQLEFIFQPFNRLSSTSKTIEGTGIGLTITKDLVEQMGGHIGVDSTPDEGSRFWFELPGTISHETESDDTGQDDDSPATAIHNRKDPSRTILIAEDNLANQLLISKQLELLGFNTQLANNGKVALDMFKLNDYVMVITDCNMPVVDGYALSESIRKLNPDIPIVAVTADAFPESQKKCYQAGMNARLVKPVDLKALEQLVEDWLK